MSTACEPTSSWRGQPPRTPVRGALVERSGIFREPSRDSHPGKQTGALSERALQRARIGNGSATDRELGEDLSTEQVRLILNRGRELYKWFKGHPRTHALIAEAFEDFEAGRMGSIEPEVG